MNMKCLLLSLSFSILMFANLYSQTSCWTFGVEAGINYSNSTEDTAPLIKKKPILYRFGVEVNYVFCNCLFLQSGLMYNAKGLKSEGRGKLGGIDVDGLVQISQQVFQMPLYMGYVPKILNSQLSVTIGPYIAYGIGGKTKAEGMINGNPFKKEVNTFGNAKILKKLDTGIGFGVRYQIKHCYIKANYELGLLDIGFSNIMGGSLDYKNRIASVVVGYQF